MLDTVMLRTGWNSAWVAATPSHAELGSCLALRLLLSLGLAGKGTVWLPGSSYFWRVGTPRSKRNLSNLPFPPHLPSVSFSFCPGEGNVSGVEPTPALPHCMSVSVHLFPLLPLVSPPQDDRHLVIMAATEIWKLPGAPPSVTCMCSFFWMLPTCASPPQHPRSLPCLDSLGSLSSP